MVSLLACQLDEFVETVFGKCPRLRTFEQVRQIVQELCHLGLQVDKEEPSDHSSDELQNHSTTQISSGEEVKGSALILGLSLDHIRATLHGFTSYILQHPAVIQSPDHIRRQLHREFAHCMLIISNVCI